MFKSCKVLGLLLAIAAVGASPLPQERRKNAKESPVIFIDFNFGGEKALRSLEQVASPSDGQNRGRAILKDSYGNPVTYDALEDIDAGKPARNNFDPSIYVIPGYASGILQPHEVPSRGTFLPETGRTVTSRSADDGRIHFIDPLTSSFDSDKKLSIPLPGLLPPSSFDSADDSSSNFPIDIPRPNLDQPETPQTAINDPLDQPLFPPNDDTSGGVGQPSFDLQLPNFNANAAAAAAKPSDSRRSFAPSSSVSSNGIDIPRPNLNAPETPIDTSNGPLNVGLVAPDFKPVGTATDFNNARVDTTNQEGTVFYTGDVVFAPKPSTGLLPPKEPNQIDSNFNFNSFNTQQAAAAAATTTTSAAPINKFTGSFGGAPGVLGGRPSLIAANNNRNNNNFGQFPVATSSQQPDSTTSRSTTVNNNQLPAAVRPTSSANKFSGSFGGPPGVLSPLGHIAPPPLPSSSSSQNESPAVAQASQANNKFGAPSTQTINQLPSVESAATFNRNKESSASKFSGSFGGPPGVLKPFDK